VPITNPGTSPNVEVPQGTIFPNGVDVSPANPVIQATVRPLGSVFRTSPGYETVRKGAHRMQSPNRFGIHFAPIQLAEDFATGDALVDKADFTKNADVADLPHSEVLDQDGRIPDEMIRTNHGVKLADSSGAPVGALSHPETRMGIEMGDRDPGRPLSKRHIDSYFKNPVNAFSDDYRQNPWLAILFAGGIVGVVYMVAKDFEGAYGRRSGSSAVSKVGAAPAAGVETAGEQVKEATHVANEAATAAGDAAKAAASAAGDVAEAAGKAASDVADAVADAVTE
jgi:hypothetical protein